MDAPYPDPEYPEGDGEESVPDEPAEDDRPDSQLFGPVMACRHTWRPRSSVLPNAAAAAALAAFKRSDVEEEDWSAFPLSGPRLSEPVPPGLKMSELRLAEPRLLGLKMSELRLSAAGRPGIAVSARVVVVAAVAPLVGCLTSGLVLPTWSDGNGTYSP